MKAPSFPNSLFAIMFFCLTLDSITIAKESNTQKVISTNIKSFTVPFKIDNSKGNYIEVQLYMSDDLGKNWKFFAKQDVTASGFRFTSQGDGEYWFALKTLNRDRQLIPPGKITEPELRIVVDTKDPEIELDIGTDAAGRIITSWNISDDFLAPESIQILHRGTTDRSDEQWISVPFKPQNRINTNRRKNFVDRVAWWPQTLSKRVEVKVEISDSAGNISTESGFVSIPNIAKRRSSTSSTTSQIQNSNTGSWTQRSKSNQVAQKPNNVVCEDGVCKLVGNPSNANKSFLPTTPSKTSVHTIGSEAEYVDPPMPQGYQPISSSKPNDPASSSIVWNSESGQFGGNQTSNGSTLNQNDFPVDNPPKAIMGLNNRFENLPVVKKSNPQFADKPIQKTTIDDNLVVSQSTTFGKGKPATQDFVNDSTPRPFESAGNNLATSRRIQPISTNQPFIPPRRDPNTQKLSVNSRRFNLNYDVQAIDPSGVGKVILWATTDDGATWNSMAVDPDNTSPFPVQVDGEGTYGFRVVINSRDGITGKPPVRGDQADVWVQVDLSVPQVSLTSAPYGSGNDIGKLIINWNAIDNQLIERPINLSYSPNANGPWTIIQDRLRNTGTYAWKVPAQVPEQIYLRIEATDEAKNTGIYQLTSPIDISGLVPRGKIYGVEPIN